MTQWSYYDHQGPVVGVKNPPEDAGLDNSESGSSMPLVYRVDNLTFKERRRAYFKDILVDCMYGQVEGAFQFYLEDTAGMPRENWRAVWCSYDLKCNILVKVTRAWKYPNAEVELVEPFHCELNEEPSVNGRGLKTKDEVLKFLAAKENKVKLVELYPVDEEANDDDDDDNEETEHDEDMEEVAKALEHYRFFYAYIWRFLDEFKENAGCYLFNDLTPRLQMYYDVKEKKVPNSIAKLYTDTMKEYHEKLRQYKIMRHSFDYDDDDKRKAFEKLQNKVKNLCGLLQKLDNPNTRANCQKRAKNAKITHLVADKFTPELIESANLGTHTTTRQHNTLASALKGCCNMDTIIIFPGRYSGRGFSKFKKDIFVKGAGKSPSDVLIFYPEKPKAYIESAAAEIHFSNLTFEGEPPICTCSAAALCVTQGEVTVNNCVFKSFPGGLRASEQSQLKVEKCEIYDIEGSGIVAELYSKVYVANTHVHHCGVSEERARKKMKGSRAAKAGIFIQARYLGRSPSQTSIELRDNKIEDTAGPGIWFQVFGECGRSYLEQPTSKSLATLEELDEAAAMACVDWLCMGHQLKNNNGVAYQEFTEELFDCF